VGRREILKHTNIIKTTKEVAQVLFGSLDENLSVIEALNDSVGFTINEEGIVLVGEIDECKVATKLIEKLLELIAVGEVINRAKIRQVFDMLNSGQASEVLPLSTQAVAITARGKTIKAKTAGQMHYVNAINNNALTFGVGPAGTGKTFLAVAVASSMYKRKLVEKIILTRPAIEAGEKLGFLPGDMAQKVDPYLRPLFDALGEMLGIENYQRLIEKGVIEIAPLAYMRGRTLNRAFIILDEAQNTTTMQMKMFLTRMGEGSRVVVNGDISQVDLPMGVLSGLKHASDLLKNVEGIAVCNLTKRDVVRHELVARIVDEYEKLTHNI